jgi:hypothetical protein
MFWEFAIGIFVMVFLVVVLMPSFWSSRTNLRKRPEEDAGPYRHQKPKDP